MEMALPNIARNEAPMPLFGRGRVNVSDEVWLVPITNYDKRRMPMKHGSHDDAGERPRQMLALKSEICLRERLP